MATTADRVNDIATSGVIDQELEETLRTILRTTPYLFAQRDINSAKLDASYLTITALAAADLELPVQIYWHKAWWSKAIAIIDDEIVSSTQSQPSQGTIYIAGCNLLHSR